MGDEMNNADEIDNESYISVELKINGAIVTVKRKRLILKSQHELLKKKRSRSRSLSSNEKVKK
jgi:hypothetical protein